MSPGIEDGEFTVWLHLVPMASDTPSARPRSREWIRHRRARRPERKTTMTHPIDQPLASPNVRARTRLQTIAAAYLALSGAISILYAGFVPIPPFSDVPVPLVGQVLGAIALVAAFGVFRQAAWGRVLGVLIVALGLGLAVLRVASVAAETGPLYALGTVAIDVSRSACSSSGCSYGAGRRLPDNRPSAPAKATCGPRFCQAARRAGAIGAGRCQAAGMRSPKGRPDPAWIVAATTPSTTSHLRHSLPHRREVGHEQPDHRVPSWHRADRRRMRHRETVSPSVAPSIAIMATAPPSASPTTPTVSPIATIGQPSAHGIGLWDQRAQRRARPPPSPRPTGRGSRTRPHSRTRASPRRRRQGLCHGVASWTQ